MRWKSRFWLTATLVSLSYTQIVTKREDLHSDLTEQFPIKDTGLENKYDQHPTREVQSISRAGTLDLKEENVYKADETKIGDKKGDIPNKVKRFGEALHGSDEEAIVLTPGVIVETEYGPVQGHPWNESPDILSFIDIPYGTIKTFFQAPELPEVRKTILDNTEHSIRCPQLQTNTESAFIEVVGEIDCLTLSIFAPNVAQNSSVLFYIPDGNFTFGSGDPSFYGPELLVSKGIILVLPNYRLGPLGFLCLQNETAPGNAALKDLTFALKWTKKNIAAFGGNPDNIVIAGDSTSGALVGYLTLSPTSRDYISKVIIESGSVLSHWAIDRNPIDTATILAEKIRKKNVKKTYNDNFFSEISLDILLLNAYDEHLRPCIDNGSDPFITQTPWYMLQEQKINISFMIGFASHAGLSEALNLDEQKINNLNKNFENILPDDLSFENNENEMHKVAERVKINCFGENAISKDTLEELSLCFTDASYLNPLLRSARLLAKAGATVYFYEFAFVGNLNRELISLGRQVNGAARGDTVGYLFTMDGQQPEEGTNDEQIVQLMTDLWISFIENGKPTAEGVEWNELITTKESEEEWLWIGTKTESRKGVHLERLKLWNEIYDAYFVENNAARALNPQRFLFIIPTLYITGIFSRSYFKYPT